MAGEGRMMFIEGKWVDRASPEFKKSMQKMKGAARATSRQMKGMVDQDMGRAMSQFNEKTEKGRQLLTAFGGAVGGAAGQVVYYTGTLSYVIGRFGVWELAIMGVVAAIGGLVWWLSKESEAEKESIERIKERKKNLDKLIESHDKWIERISLAGYTEGQQRIKKYTEEIERQKEAIEKIKERILEWRKEGNAIEQLQRYGKVPGYLARELLDAQMELGKLMKMKKEAYKQDKAAFDLEVDKAEFEEKMEQARLSYEKYKESLRGKEKGKGVGGGIGSLGWGLTQQLEPFMGMLVPAGTADEFSARMREQWDEQRMQAQERIEIERLMTEVYEEEAERRLEIAEEEARAAEEKIQHQMAIVENTVGLFGQLGDVLTKGTKANTAARIAAIVMEATWDAAKYAYKAIAAGASGNFLAAAEYTTAALMAAAVAAGNVQEAASGGGGGGGGGGASVGARESAQGGWGSREPEKSEGLVIHIHAGVLTGSDAGKEILNAIQQHDDAWSPGRARKGMS